jgi:hypothetical protein
MPTESSLWYACDEAARHAGLKKRVAPHLLENGADLPTIQILMGHADLEATSLYLHLSRRHLEKAINPLEYLSVSGVGETNRFAISNHRLLAFDGEHVTFRWKDYAGGGEQRNMTLTATEFLRRFFLHVLSKGFVRIRHFGFLSNRFRGGRLPLCQKLLAMGASQPEESSHPGQDLSTWHCPHCGAAMVVVQRLTAAETSWCNLRFVMTTQPAMAAGRAYSTPLYPCASWPLVPLPADSIACFRSNPESTYLYSEQCIRKFSVAYVVIIRLVNTKTTSNRHSQRPPQTPAASF